ncbi:MAG: hypothetical protein WBZ20_08155, partial [Nitrososphaeraceae archaeon]
HISIAAADEIYSYFQEKIGLTHYLFFTGGNNSGKSNNLTKIHYTAYRNMMSTDMTLLISINFWVAEKMKVTELYAKMKLTI